MGNNVSTIRRRGDRAIALKRRPKALPLLFLLLSAVLMPLATHAAGQSATACGAAGVAPTAPRLHIAASGARRVAGNVTFTLYGDDPARFLAHHGSLALVRVTLTGRDAEACFAVSAAGSYAVAIYHDENNDHHFNRTLIGLPAEGYGFSNNVTPLFGLPSFRSVRFDVGPVDTKISIALRY